MTGAEVVSRRHPAAERLAAVLAVLALLAALVPVAPAAADTGVPLRAEVEGTGDHRPDVLLHGRGWGHGVGLSQIGAHAMALSGRSAAEILTYYYAGTEVTSDTRATTQRIRVGITRGQSATSVRALDAPVTWQVCTPEVAPAANGRVPAERCADWFVQEVDETIQVAPIGAASVTADAVFTHVGDDLTTLVEVVPGPTDPGTTDPDPTDPDATDPDATDPDPTDPDATDPDATDPAPSDLDAPLGGLRVTSGSAGTRAYVTPDDGRGLGQLPVLRVRHGDARIEAQSYAGSPRVYAWGWRDLHLTGDRVNDPVSHRLAVVQDVDTVERYLRGLAEVPSSWPAAALEAQAIAGRTYALRGSRGGACRCDRLATASDQVFIGESKAEEPVYGVRWAAAVEATRDQVLTYQGTLAETYYSSSFGGRSENVEDSWAYYRAYQDATRQPPPYLRSVDDPWSLLTEVDGVPVSNSRREWTATATNAAMVGLLNRERTALGLSAFTVLERIRIGDRTQGGTPSTLIVTGRTAAGISDTMTYRGVRSSDGRTLTRPIAGANLRMELPVTGGESNGRISSSQVNALGFGPFRDDDGSVHELAISWAASVGVVRGIDELRFAPERSVTRAQMATYLVNTFDVPPATLPEPFADVRADEVHRANIEALVAAGIASGFGDGTYGPDELVTRAQMATFLANTLGWVTETRGSFTDVPPGDTHGANIEAIAERGVTTGCTAERYCGADPVQRGQLTSFLYRVVRG